ncbi:MAG: cyclic pyranopterin monophosphate synthase MoaC [Nitrospirota bacterium]
MKLTHFDEEGRSRMVDVSKKKVTKREAVAKGSVFMKSETLRLIKNQKISKGDVLGVAKIAGIMGTKRTSEFIPMCHPLSIDAIDINFNMDEKKKRIDIEARVRVEAKTGVEMEALTAVAISALTIYDMCKSVDKGMVISDICLMEKRGGKSGEYSRNKK